MYFLYYYLKMHGVTRKLQAKVLELLESFPAVALLGPRQCGKTTLAFEIKAAIHSAATPSGARATKDL